MEEFIHFLRLLIENEDHQFIVHRVANSRRYDESQVESIIDFPNEVMLFIHSKHKLIILSFNVHSSHWPIPIQNGQKCANLAWMNRN
jgi:hypothetical protein